MAFQPAVHGPHVSREAKLCGPQSYMHFRLIVELMEQRNKKILYYDFQLYQTTAVANMMGLILYM